MKTTIVIICVGIAGIARAEGPGYQLELSRCRLTCYTPKPQEKREEPRQICGYQDYSFSQVSLGRGRWSTLESGGVPLASPTELKPCRIPKATGGKWGPILAQARRDFPGLDRGDVVTIAPGESFSTEKVMLENAAGKLVLTERRWISIRIYSKTFDLRPNECGSTDPNVVCELSSDGRGGSLGYNLARLRLDEAHKLKAANDLKLCQTAAWHVVGIARTIEKLREVRKKENKWPATRKFLTHTTGPLDEKALFAALAAMASDATAVFKACGGDQKDLADAYDAHLGP